MEKKNELIIIRNTIADIVLYIKEEELLNWLKYNILYHCYSQFKYQTKLLYSCSTYYWNLKLDIWKKAINVIKRILIFLYVGICRNLNLEDM